MELFDTIKQKAKELDFNMYSLCEVYNGKIRCEDLQKTTIMHDCYSVAKVFTVTALAMLYDKGILTFDEKITEILHDELPPDIDEKWHDVTIENVIHHKIGFASGFVNVDLDVSDPTVYGHDHLKLIFEQKLAYKPGENRAYSDSAYYILSRVFTKKTGEILDDFMMREFFVPLGFGQVAWSRCPMGYTVGGTGLFISTGDLAKLGILFLNDGVWNGKRILSHEVIDIILNKRYELAEYQNHSHHKGGMLGQCLYFNIEKNRVIAFHSADASDEIYTIIEMLVDMDI